MKINVAQQLKQSIGCVQWHKINEVENAHPVQGEIKLLRTDRGILVSGMVKTIASSVCSRCLQEFDIPLTLNIEEEYFPTVDVVSGAPLPAPEEPGSFTIDQNHVIDLGEAVHQYALLTIPMKPVCRVDCRGLCPYCGCNLNYETCNCVVNPSDPRWAKLSGLASAGEIKKGVR